MRISDWSSDVCSSDLLFQGYRLLQEYFAFPDRYRFFSINGLGPALERIGASQTCKAFELTVLLDSSVPELENLITAEHLALHCTPAINLVSRRADRIAVSTREHEHKVVVESSEERRVGKECVSEGRTG